MLGFGLFFVFGMWRSEWDFSIVDTRTGAQSRINFFFLISPDFKVINEEATSIFLRDHFLLKVKVGAGL